MYAYMTIGTVEFLQKILEQHPSEKMLLLHENQGQAHMIHETEGKTIFYKPKKFEVITQVGQLTGGIAVCYYQQISNKKELFELAFAQYEKLIINTSGFQCLRFLRPIKNDTYVIFVVFDKESSLSKFEKTDEFQRFLSIEKTTQAFMVGANYTRYFHAI